MLALGAAELALAAQKVRDGRAGGWVRQSAYWAGEYREQEAGGDTLNLYDVSARGCGSPSTPLPAERFGCWAYSGGEVGVVDDQAGEV
ncbi:hypothetical protein F1D05_05520 [Kribbella qitaiheensis]|uniref:Uncharacterized protein n=1 Tax=Kribbella qitaiheensis TaxID=1544730 RepID=A0A7G6WU03_9ACTN|nr:hypothetical protein F1D05_05520 [Kribbella qitaiheensis]